MNRLFVALVAAVCTVTSSMIGHAADMPAKAPVDTTPLAAATPWTGFYVNGGIGYGSWAADTTIVNTPTGVCSNCPTQVQGGKGWLGTIGGGYDFQFSNRIVGGIFGDASPSSLKGTIQDGQPFRAGEITEKWSWGVGVRAGWLSSPQTMTYVNGGYTSARFSSADMLGTFAGIPTGLSTPAVTMNGWFLGGGIETTLDLLGRGWFWRNEYRYSYYTSKSLPEAASGSSITFKPTVQTVTTQIVYKFNGGLSTPVYPAIPAVTTNWTGFLASAGLGYGLWSADTITINPVTGICLLCVSQRQGGKGWLGTVGAGYDWQFAPRWVTGVFGDYDFARLKGTVQDQWAGGPFAFSGDIRQTSAWAVGPRIGWLANPQTLTYVNGGYTSARFSGATMVGLAGQGIGFVTQPFTTNGWFVGGGVETAFNLFGLLGRGWFWRNEYRYASYGSKTLAEAGPVPPTSVDFKPVVQTIVSQVVFKFN